MKHRTEKFKRCCKFETGIQVDPQKLSRSQFTPSLSNLIPVTVKIRTLTTKVKRASCSDRFANQAHANQSPTDGTATRRPYAELHAAALTSSSLSSSTVLLSIFSVDQYPLLLFIGDIDEVSKTSTTPMLVRHALLLPPVCTRRRAGDVPRPAHG